MSQSPQRRAIDNYRKRLSAQGLARFEVVGRDADRELIRAVAKRMAEGGAEAERLRAAVSQVVPSQKGGIVRALLASPLVGSGLALTRVREAGRKVDL